MPLNRAYLKSKFYVVYIFPQLKNKTVFLKGTLTSASIVTALRPPSHRGGKGHGATVPQAAALTNGHHTGAPVLSYRQDGGWEGVTQGVWPASPSTF